MTDERLITAIERIESALTRIEQTAHPAPRHDADELVGMLDTLAQRHQALRARTSEVIARLDRLIATPPLVDETVSMQDAL